MEVCVDAPTSDRTLVLVGRTGNGKSATGNMILGEKRFSSEVRATGVTRTCQLETATVQGRTINVIDTPGLFDLSMEADFIAQEIVKCLSLAKDGIHGVLLVFSARNRLTEEEKQALLTIRSVFGRDIVDYLVIVFTGGDDLEDADKTLDSYLADSPPFLKEIRELCDNRVVLFNNRERDRGRKKEQVDKLFKMVDSAVSRNNGKPFIDELLHEMEKEKQKYLEKRKMLESVRVHSNRDVSQELNKLEEDYHDKISVIVQKKRIATREKMLRQEKKLTEERLQAEKKLKKEKLQAEKMLKEAQNYAKTEIDKLRREIQVLKDRKPTTSGPCNHL